MQELSQELKDEYSHAQKLYCASGLRCEECKFVIVQYKFGIAFKIQGNKDWLVYLEKHIREAHADRAKALLDYDKEA